jgi:hypothetical protein
LLNLLDDKEYWKEHAKKLKEHEDKLKEEESDDDDWNVNELSRRKENWNICTHGKIY